MKILALLPSLYDTNPGQRFRIEQWEPLLAERGVEITYSPFETPELRKVIYSPGHTLKKITSVAQGFQRRHQELQAVGQYDLVYVFREAALLGPAWFERMVAARVPMLFDFDDAVFVPYRSPSNGYLSYLKFPAKTRTICRLATHVMAGNPYLADYARQVNESVSIVPTTIDTTKYQLRDKSHDGSSPVIGWSGSYSTVQHFDTLRSVMPRLAQTRSFSLRVIGTPHYELPGVDVTALPWKSETEVADLSRIDIGVMPLPDDQWSKGKCGLKALQYMALGIPTICSPVGVNREIIQDGENGFLAESEEEWIEKLTRLVDSPQLRQRLGEAGRITVEEKYSASVQAPRVHRIMQEAIAVNRHRRSDLAG